MSDVLTLSRRLLYRRGDSEIPTNSAGDVGFAFMYFDKIATILLANAVINPPRFAFCTQAGAVSRMPFTNQAEENGYSNASGQTDAAAKVTAINAFLTKYPASHARQDLLEQLMAVYVREPDMNKVTETAARILSVDSRNLRALSANPKDAKALLDNAASEANSISKLSPVGTAELSPGRSPGVQNAT